ncbi:MAG: hypothetical protein ABI232_09850 [Jatrophihabitantaceae bacterium]
MSRNFRIAMVTLALLPALTLAGCASITNGTGTTDAGGTGTGGPSGSNSANRATPTDAAGLFAFMKSGVQSLTSAHLAMTIQAAGGTITAAGDEKIADGKLAAMDLTEAIPEFGSLHIVLIGDTTYMQLPTKYNTSGKPWQLVSADSTNPVIQQMAKSLASIQSSASMDRFTAFARAAKSVTSKGTDQIDGASAAHYAIVVDIAKLPDSTSGKDTLIQAGITTLPVDLWLDAQGRPVKLTEKLTAGGQSVSTVVTLTKYDAPVTITAPPADQVSTD